MRLRLEGRGRTGREGGRGGETEGVKQGEREGGREGGREGEDVEWSWIPRLVTTYLRRYSTSPL